MPEHAPVEQIPDASPPGAKRKPWSTPHVITSEWRETYKSTDAIEWTFGAFHFGPS
jgi:hypothetical protein